MKRYEGTDRYIVLQSGQILDLIDELRPLYDAYKARETGSDEVFLDALCEWAVWSGAGNAWGAAQKNKLEGTTLLWVGCGRVRQLLNKKVRKYARFPQYGMKNKQGWSEVKPR